MSIRFLLSPRVLEKTGKGSGLTGGRPSFGPSPETCLPASPDAGVKVSDVGRELGGVGTYTGTGFRQPIPREFEGAIAVVICELILPQLGR
jgi:hypothetical protein